MQPMSEAKKLVLTASIATMFGGAAAPALAADDELVDKLYEKGVLTEEEANALKTEEDDPYDMVGSFKKGVKWESEDGQFGIQLHGRVQLDYRSSDLPDEVGEPPVAREIDEFQLRRAYLGVKGKYLKNWTYELTYDLAKSRVEYAYLNYKWSNSIQARGGHFKFPLGFAQLTSSRFTDFMERPFTDEYEPGKDLGVMVYGEPKKKVFWYGLGYSNGSGRQNAPEVDKKDTIARGAVNFAPLANWDKGVLHFGLNWRDGAFDTAGTEFDRTTIQYEGVGAWGPVKLQGEYADVDFDEGSGLADAKASYVSLVWLITGEQYVNNYSLTGMKTIKPLKPLHKGGWGAWEVGVRFSETDLGRLPIASDDPTENNVESTTVGIKWIPNQYTRFLLNWVENKFEVPFTDAAGNIVDKETRVDLRAQIYF
ncbi:MAG: hypothetical protein JSW48_04135 [Betaproteobacteria bacterium]|nr:MAG: hypothetical protein JSW48_04135 [Betaproteobacteria bacterium]